jgi:hypothetical protein
LYKTFISNVEIRTPLRFLQSGELSVIGVYGDAGCPVVNAPKMGKEGAIIVGESVISGEATPT